MKVVRDIDRDGNICSPLDALLKTLDNEERLMYYTEHGQRHPHAIYNRSWERFRNAYIELIAFLGDQSDIKKYRSGTELFVKTKEVIESIDAFVDDTYIIMKCFVPKRMVAKDISFADKWLEKVDSAVINDYKSNIRFVEPMQLAINKFRHNHGEIGQINANAFGFGNAYGFFILAANDSGSIIPCPEIHKPYRGLHTAFSYNRFLLEAFADFYLISYQAEKTLTRFLKVQAGYEYERKKIEIDSSNYIDLISRLYSALTKFLFDDEYDKCPQVDWNGKSLTVKDVPDKTFIKRFVHPKACQMSSTFSGDGYSRSWGMPYLGDPS